MNIIIPLGGKGERFEREGYTVPKPLIRFLGRPLILWVLEQFRNTPGIVVWIAHRPELNKYNLQTLCQKEFPELQLRFICLEKETKDVCETVAYALSAIHDLQKPVAVIDGDSYYPTPILRQFLDSQDHAIAYKTQPGSSSIFSFITLNAEGFIDDIAEKQSISDHYCTGFYGFRSGLELSDGINQTPKNTGETYLSAVYKHFLNQGKKIKGIEVNDHIVLGTPAQLRCAVIDDSKKYRFCFDLDNTLVTCPTKTGDYAAVEPCHETIAFVQFLKQHGHTIIISTARRMLTHNFNAGAATADIAKITIETLDRYKIPYDELHFGKPFAHFYIDDSAVRPSEDLEKMTGIYDLIVRPRTINKIQYNANRIRKESKELEGELYFYRHVPEEIADLFPAYHGGGVLENGNFYIEMERINGIPLSHFNTSGLLTKTHLLDVLSDLERIHQAKPPKPADQPADIYAIYENKLLRRIAQFDYKSFPNAESMIDEILVGLRRYKEEARGDCCVIHGDPVFTNILVGINERKYYIDMRGMSGEQLTLFGDRFYDFAKVYQSLIGYDHILMGQERTPNQELLSFFEEYIVSQYGSRRFSEMVLIVKSLVISLLPYHFDNEAVCQRLFQELLVEYIYARFP